MMAHEMVRDWGCTYSAAKSAIRRAIKRSEGKAAAWGGTRPGSGRPPKAEQAEQEDEE